MTEKTNPDALIFFAALAPHSPDENDREFIIRHLEGWNDIASFRNLRWAAHAGRKVKITMELEP